MAKSSGGTRATGPGGATPAPVDENAAWRAAEGSERYTYDSDKVKFNLMLPVTDLDGTPFDGITPAMLRYKTDYAISNVFRDMKDGKFHIGLDNEYWYEEKMTFNQAINRVIKDVKTSYKHNERLRDTVMVIDSDDDNAPTAWIWVSLEGNNKVRISINRFKPYNQIK